MVNQNSRSQQDRSLIEGGVKEYKTRLQGFLKEQDFWFGLWLLFATTHNSYNETLATFSVQATQSMVSKQLLPTICVSWSCSGHSLTDVQPREPKSAPRATTCAWHLLQEGSYRMWWVCFGYLISHPFFLHTLLFTSLHSGTSESSSKTSKYL